MVAEGDDGCLLFLSSVSEGATDGLDAVAAEAGDLGVPQSPESIDKLNLSNYQS